MDSPEPISRKMAGLFLIANFTAAITTQLTLDGLKSSISNVDDLPGKAVVTLVDSTAAEFLSNRRIAFSTVNIVEEAYERLANGRADAFVYDAPVLQYYASGEGKGIVQVVGSEIQPELYGIALPLESEYRREIRLSWISQQAEPIPRLTTTGLAVNKKHPGNSESPGCFLHFEISAC